VITVWWDCDKDDVESLGLSQKDAQFRNKWKMRIKGKLANPGSPGKTVKKGIKTVKCIKTKCMG